MIRRCSKCGAEYPATTEHFHKLGKKLRPDCKKCRALYFQGRKAELRARRIKQPKPTFPQGFKQCSACKQVLLETEFYRHTASPDGLKANCKQCSLAQKRAATAKKRAAQGRLPKGELTTLRKRAKSIVKRAKKKQAQGKVTPIDLNAMIRSQKGRCWYCGANISKHYHIDHRVPLSRGGSNDPSNLCLACPRCNISKGSKLPHEWGGRLL